MRWSYSASRTFRQCQRQWYFKNIVASARAKEPIRRRAYLLSKLQSVSAWRGKIVDNVISRTIIPSINRHEAITLRVVKARARELFDRQLAYALKHPIGNLDLQVSGEGDDFAVLYGMEYGAAPTEQEVQQAWSDVEQALTNLFEIGDVRGLLKSAKYVVAQRALQYNLMEGITVLAYPDAIVFQPNDRPVIVDWKVHAFGQNDAWLQLAIYAIALSRSKHSDFPTHFSSAAKDVVLLEVQLLTEVVREHHLDEDQIEEVEEYAIASAYEMACLTEGRKYADLKAEDFRLAVHAETCQRCAFRAICWGDGHVH